MNLKQLYDNIAKNYSIADQFSALTKSHETALFQMQYHNLTNLSPFKVLDLGVGSGDFLKKLKCMMPHAELTGLDVSPEMLRVASQNFEITTIEGSANNASQLIPLKSQNLIIAHFINAYLPTTTLLMEVKALLKTDGYFSFVTTTYESFPNAQSKLIEFINTRQLLGAVVGHYYKAITQHTLVPQNLSELKENLSFFGLQLLEHKRLNLVIQLNNINELMQFGIEGTWFLNLFSIKFIPKKLLLSQIKRIFKKIITFPYQDTHIIDIILAKK